MFLEEYLAFSVQASDSPHIQNHEALVDHIESTVSNRAYGGTLFTTPNLAHWLDESHPFLNQVVNKIWPTAFSQPKLRCAVVDAIPDPRQPPTLNERNPLPGLPWSETGHEGVSLRLTSAAEHIFSLEGQFLKPEGDPEQQHGLIHFEFRAKQSFGVKGSNSPASSVILPAANALFINGRPSIMFSTSWTKIGNGSATYKLAARRNMEHVYVKNGNMFRPDGGSRFPHIQLTPARRIVSSLGNVLKQIQVDAGSPLLASTAVQSLNHSREPFSASLELETIVPMLHDRLQKEGNSQDTPPQIFAAIIPAHKRDICMPGYYSLDRQVTEGASLHKITGGGGGWGSKQGLLSLEPAIDFSLSAPSMSQFDTSQLETGSRAALDDLLAPGNLVIFYATHPSFGRTSRGSNDSLLALGGRAYKQTTLGVIAGISTITPPTNVQDESYITSLIHKEQQEQQPRPSPLPSSPPAQSLTQSPIIHVQGFFGMLSEGGMALEKREIIKSQRNVDEEAVKAQEQSPQKQVTGGQHQERQEEDQDQQRSVPQAVEEQSQQEQEQQDQKHNEKRKPRSHRLCATRLDVPGFRFNFLATPSKARQGRRRRGGTKPTVRDSADTTYRYANAKY